MKFDIYKKEQEGWLYENGAGKKITGHSKLKLWTFFWGQGEREWPLDSMMYLLNYIAVPDSLVLIFHFKHMFLLFLTNTLQVSLCIPPDSKLLHLEEGVTEEFYNEFIASPPPSQQPSHSQVHVYTCIIICSLHIQCMPISKI